MGASSTKRSVLASTFVLAVVLGSPAAARADCDIARFGDETAAGTCDRNAPSCLPAYLPEDVRRIGRGAVLETVGLAVNEGRAGWRALDIDRLELVVVERYAGPRRAQAPTVAASSEQEALKPADAQGAVDYVRRVPLSEHQVSELACLAAGLWSAERVASTSRTDTASRFYLLRPDKVRSFAANGTFAGKPLEFMRLADAALPKRRARP
jgi:hypothetical protein